MRCRSSTSPHSATIRPAPKDSPSSRNCAEQPTRLVSSISAATASIPTSTRRCSGRHGTSSIYRRPTDAPSPSSTPPPSAATRSSATRSPTGVPTGVTNSISDQSSPHPNTVRTTPRGNDCAARTSGPPRCRRWPRPCCAGWRRWTTSASPPFAPSPWGSAYQWITSTTASCPRATSTSRSSATPRRPRIPATAKVSACTRIPGS